MFPFTIRDVLWLTVVVALIVVWRVDLCLLTGEPNELQAKLHDRMPIILDPAHYNAWLDPANGDRETLQRMLVPFPSERMSVRPVSTFVNNARNEGVECIAWMPRCSVVSRHDVAVSGA